MSELVAKISRAGVMIAETICVAVVDVMGTFYHNGKADHVRRTRSYLRTWPSRLFDARIDRRAVAAVKSLGVFDDVRQVLARRTGVHGRGREHHDGKAKRKYSLHVILRSNYSSLTIGPPGACPAGVVFSKLGDWTGWSVSRPVRSTTLVSLAANTGAAANIKTNNPRIAFIVPPFWNIQMVGFYRYSEGRAILIFPVETASVTLFQPPGEPVHEKKTEVNTHPQQKPDHDDP